MGTFTFSTIEVVPRYDAALELMALLFDKITRFPWYEIVVVAERRVIRDDKPGEKPRLCFVFPPVDGVAQAFDHRTGVALHVTTDPSRRDACVRPLYELSEREFYVVAPFQNSRALAVTKSGRRPVIIDLRGEVVVDPVPRSMMDKMLKIQ